MRPNFCCPFSYFDGNIARMHAVPAIPPVPTVPVPPTAPAFQLPAQPGTTPAQPMTLPAVQPGMTPTMPGMTPAQPGMNPMMPGMMPGMSPMMPGLNMPMFPGMGGSMMPGMTPMMPGMGGTEGMDPMDWEDTGMEGTESPVSDPPPVLSNNPATATIVLFKELTGYPNYGNPSGNADILYTGNRGTWTFELPAILFIPGQLRAQLIIRAVLDDHANVPVSQYSARIAVNGTVVHNGPVPLQHGTPAGGRFTNWSNLIFNVPNIRRTNRVTIQNTSTAGPNDWIAFDWMEMRFTTR